MYSISNVFYIECILVRMYSICVSTNLYKGMFQGTKIHIIIHIPFIYAPKKQKNDARRAKFFHFFIQITPSGRHPAPQSSTLFCIGKYIHEALAFRGMVNK